MELGLYNKKAVAGEIKKPIRVEDIENIIVNSFEGGSTYWMGVNNSTAEWNDKPQSVPFSIWATKILLDGGKIKVYDIEGTEDDDNWYITLEGITNGISVWSMERRNNMEDWDADDCDCVVQIAIFGKVLFC